MNSIPIVPVLALVDVDNIDQFLHEETEWSEYEESVNDVYDAFISWMRHKYQIRKYRKNIFINKLETKRTLSPNGMYVKNIKIKTINYEDFTL